MIKLIGNDIVQNGHKVGWLHGNDIFNVSGDKIGYYSENDIYNRERKIGYVEGNYIKMVGSSQLISVQENRLRVSGGTYSDVCRAAIRLLFGD
jgi:hypothetical protein